MKTIWKFPLVFDRQPVTGDWISAYVPLPDGARILSVDVQSGQITTWAVVDPNAPRHAHEFRAFPTGAVLAGEVDAVDFIGTVSLPASVWHIWCAPIAPSQPAGV